MASKAVKGYSDVIGKHAMWVGDHTGPASYVQWVAPNTGGDTVGASTKGLRSLDFVAATGISVSGTYYVQAKLTTAAGSNPSNTNNAPMVQKAILVWYLTATPGTQPAAGTSLSGESVRILCIGG